MNELVKKTTYLSEGIEKVDIEVYENGSTGIETTSITIWLSNGTFRVYESQNQM